MWTSVQGTKGRRCCAVAAAVRCVRWDVGRAVGVPTLCGCLSGLGRAVGLHATRSPAQAISRMRAGRPAGLQCPPLFLQQSLDGSHSDTCTPELRATSSAGSCHLHEQSRYSPSLAPVPHSLKPVSASCLAIAPVMLTCACVAVCRAACATSCLSSASKSTASRPHSPASPSPHTPKAPCASCSSPMAVWMA